VAENRWRKIEVRMWGDEKFRTLSPIQPSGQALWIYLLTGPHTGPIPGLFRAGRAALAEELGWEQKAFDKAFQEAFALGMVKADWKARVVFIPRAIICNSPQSPNVITSWAGEWQLIPECELKCEAYQAVRSAIYECGEAFQKAFDKAFAKPSRKTMANQEQEQEQEQERNTPPELKNSSGSASPSRKKKSAKTQVPENFGISDAVRKWALTKNYGRLEDHLERFIGDVKAHGRTYVNWDQAFENAIRDDWAKLRTPQNGRGKISAIPKQLDYTLTDDEAVRRAGLETARTAGARN
jgi:hypothetical protein